MYVPASKQAAVGSDVHPEWRSCRTPAFLLPSLSCLTLDFFFSLTFNFPLLGYAAKEVKKYRQHVKRR